MRLFTASGTHIQERIPASNLAAAIIQERTQEFCRWVIAPHIPDTNGLVSVKQGSQGLRPRQANAKWGASLQLRCSAHGQCEQCEIFQCE